MTTTFRRRPAVTGALTGVLTIALLAGCGGPGQTGEGGASPSPAIAAATSTSAASAAPTPASTPEAAPEATPTAARADTGASDPSAGNNAADVLFARRMLPHHLQALEMARLAETRAGDPWVREFASKVATSRDTDIRTLKDWLDMWGAEPLPRDHSMPGMRTRAEMEALAGLNGPRFDRRYVTLMIKHDKGAIGLAETEQAKGAFAGAKALAVAIATSQAAEIKELEKYLALLD